MFLIKNIFVLTQIIIAKMMEFVTTKSISKYVSMMAVIVVCQVKLPLFVQSVLVIQIKHSIFEEKIVKS